MPDSQRRMVRQYKVKNRPKSAAPYKERVVNASSWVYAIRRIDKVDWGTYIEENVTRLDRRLLMQSR